ncbi:MAG: UbiA family prenyltransferase [Hyphomicrobiales bacterium]
MAEPASELSLNGFARLKLFWALSRTPHGLLDMCTPAFAALLWLGALPSINVILIGVLTIFAGYTAVYALNDVVDYRVDREKAAAGVLISGTSDLDGVITRHPMAQGLLSFAQGLAWVVCWSVVALIGAYVLNPVCVIIFVGGCACEAAYCRLWRVSPYRTLVSGAVKTSGAVAAVFAVDPHPSAPFLIALFLTLFLWEIGGQNIPNDLTDLEEDRRLRARTIPVSWGIKRAADIAVAALAGAVLFSAMVFLLSPLHHKSFFALLALGVGGWLLIKPGLRLFREQDRATAMALFNRASYYPPALLAVVLLGLL